MLLATRHGAVLASTVAMNQLKALIVTAPDELRAELRKLKRLPRSPPPALSFATARPRDSSAG